MSKRKRTRYTDEFRASAVLMLEAAGYPDTKGALEKVSGHISVPGSTLHRWFHAKQNPPPSELVSEKKIDLVASIKTELAHIFDEFGNTRKDAEYRELAVAFGILVDKMQLLSNKPTGIVRVVQLMQEGKIAPETVKERWPNIADELFQQAGIKTDAGN